MIEELNRLAGVIIGIGLHIAILFLFLHGLKKIHNEHKQQLKWALEFQLRRPINLAPHIETIFWGIFFLLLFSIYHLGR